MANASTVVPERISLKTLLLSGIAILFIKKSKLLSS